MVSMILSFLSHGSYLAIALVLVASGAGLPLPEEVPVLTAGLLAANGQMEPWLALVTCILGAVAGDMVVYAAGRIFGRNAFLEHPRLAHFVNPQREAKIEKMIQRHGLKVLFVARFLVGVRSAVYLAAGILRVPVRRFLLTDLCCATAVVSTFFFLSYYHGPTITRWIRNAEVLVTVVVVLAVVGLVAFFWRRRRKKLQESSREAAGEAHEAEEESDLLLIATAATERAP